MNNCQAPCHQGNSVWPGQGMQQTGTTAWPAQPCQPCWPYQPNWPGTQTGTPNPPNWPGNPSAQTSQQGWPAPQPQQVLPNPPVQPPQPAQPQPVPPPQPVQPQPVPPTQPAQPTWPAPQPAPGCMPGWPGNPGQPGWPGQCPSNTQQPWPISPTGPVTVPFNMNFPRGIYDKLMLTIRGQVKPDAKMFTVNFLRGNDIALHINPRFNEGGKQVVVRNHKLGERWGKEERNIQSPFPFIPGQHFEMRILCTFTEFKVTVNNTALFEFKHRIKEVNQIDRINILHDVTLTSVNVETLP
ncbi:galectin-3 [Chanos chanos]|uniref:Galectin n=1 Tax=Chanos chanos TaxID=29144 RepID=A0A6J2V8B4_CHACN|nr:galectin-3-like [Chanos chanos]